ncbi:hypothetical protein VTN96DRAFT_3216 [Rasamsonia emersonii]
MPRKTVHDALQILAGKKNVAAKFPIFFGTHHGLASLLRTACFGIFLGVLQSLCRKAARHSRTRRYAGPPRLHHCWD